MNNKNLDTLYKLGLSKELEEYWQKKFNRYDLGRISTQHRDLYKIVTTDG